MARAFLIGENHRLQHVHHLCDVGHFHALGVLVEDVQRERGYEGIAQGILLIEMAGNGAGLFIPPCAPFVDEQVDMAFGVFLIHNGNVLLDHLFNLQALAKGPVVLVVVEIGGRAFRAAPS